MEFLSMIMGLSFSEVVVIAIVLGALWLFGGGELSLSTEIDVDEEYENASWNPASVNYDR